MNVVVSDICSGDEVVLTAIEKRIRELQAEPAPL